MGIILIILIIQKSCLVEITEDILFSLKKNKIKKTLMQSDREKVEGLPVAPFMDREKVTKPTAQIGFIKFVLIPMFETVMKVRR